MQENQYPNEHGNLPPHTHSIPIVPGVPVSSPDPDQGGTFPDVDGDPVSSMPREAEDSLACPERQAATATLPKKRKSKKLKWTLLAIACVLILLIGGIFVYAGTMLGQLDRTEITGDPTLGIEELTGDDEHFDEPDDMEGINAASDSFASIKDMPIAHSEDVYNLLLIGCDSRKNNFSGRSDSAMILSINRKTGKLHLTSLMRAMYVYISGRDEYYMLNASYSWGGTKMLIDTIETNFRVKIDDYMVINFGGFEKVVDIAGGVDIEMTSAEARYLNFGNEGLYHMNGSKALSYARLRHLDTDFKRTGRQRAVIEALLRRAWDMNLSQLHNTAAEMFPNINTSMTNMEILSLAGQVGKYVDAPMDQMMLPLECNDEEDPYKTKFYYKHMEMYHFNYRDNILELWKFIYECDQVEDVPTIPFTSGS